MPTTVAFDKPCQAQKDAGITHPDSLEGAQFCIKRCPYPHCIFDDQKSIERKKNIRKVVRLRKKGLFLRQIAEELGISMATVRVYLKKWEEQQHAKKSLPAAQNRKTVGQSKTK